jgi:hypothetical protein
MLNGTISSKSMPIRIRLGHQVSFPHKRYIHVAIGVPVAPAIEIAFFEHLVTAPANPRTGKRHLRTAPESLL